MALFRKSPAKNSAAAVLNRRRYPSVWKYVTVGTLALLCLIAGAAFCLNFLRSPKDEQTQTVALVEADELGDQGDGEDADPQLSEELLGLAEQALLSGDPESALVIYRNSDLDSPSAIAIRYRMAVCYETLGDFEQARKHFQFITGSTVDRGFTRAAKLGLVRTHMATAEWDLAANLLYEVILSGGNADEPNGTAFHQLARIATESLPGSQRPLYENSGLLSPDWKTQVEKLLALPNACSTAISLPFAQVQVGVVSKIRNAPESVRVTVKASDGTVKQLVDHILAKAGLALLWDAPGRESIRITHIDVADLDVATLLEALLQPNGMTWTIDGAEVRIVDINDVTPEDQIDSHFRRAERYCNNALALFPEHAYAVRTYLLLGNIAYQSGDAERASNYYRQILNVSRKLEIVGDTWFNHAKSLRKAGQLNYTVDAFTKVVDHARGREIESVAYLYLGEIALESGDSHSAVKNLVRAVTVARSPDVRQLSALTLAAAYLMESNPLAANMALMEHRELLKSSPYHANSWFLSSLARFRAAGSPTERFHRGRTLTSALTEVTPERFFTTAGIVLLGQAYFEIGLQDEMQSVYETYLTDAEPNFVMHRAMFTLADSYINSGATDRGRELFSGMLEGEETAWSERARLRLAELDLAAGRVDACLENCIQVVKTSPQRESQSRALSLMGKVYEAKDDHLKAALCFAGMMPHESTASRHDEAENDANQVDRRFSQGVR